MEQNEKARYKKWFPFTTYDLDELNNRDIVFCFHHAGGSASVYRKWTLKKEKINFVCVELPGKGTRRKERFIENFEELVGPLVESIINVADDRNILFFGHSMGAAMAFYAAAYMAQNYGAGLHERIRLGLKSAVKFAALLSVIISCAMILGGKFILRLFVDQQNPSAPEVLEIAYHYLFIMSCLLCILYLLYVFREAIFFAEPFAWLAAAVVLAVICLKKVKELDAER